MSVKKQKDVVRDITEQTLLTLDGVAEEISEQAVQEEVDNFIADRSLKENQKEVIAIANKVREYKKGDKTNFGVVVDVSASSITFKGKDTPKTKIVFNQRKMGSKDYVLSALSKINEGIHYEEGSDISKDILNVMLSKPFSKWVKFDMESYYEGGGEDAKKQILKDLAKFFKNIKISNESLLKVMDSEQFLDWYSGPFDEFADNQNNERMKKGILKDISTFFKMNESMQYMGNMNDMESEEEHYEEGIEEEKDMDMKEARMNKQDREKLQSILKSKKFIELDEINDENEIEDLLELQDQGFLPDDIESIYHYGSVPVYGAAVIFYPDDDGLTILKGRKNIGGYTIQSLLKDMSIFDGIEESEEGKMIEAESDEETIQSLAAKLELTDDQVETLLVKSNEKYGEEGEAMLLDMLNMLAQVVDKEEEQEDEESDTEVDTTDIEELVKDEEGLTEGFKEKASIIFEAAVAAKVKNTKAMLKEQYATRLQEEVETVKENLVEKIDSYLTYAVETWVEDNKVAVESTLRTEITESFIGSLKNLFTEHYIEVPEGKVNLVSTMEAQVSELKEQVATKGRIANALADRVEKLTRQKVIAEASSGLADTQIAKLTEMVEDVEFINEETFSKKVATIREFYVNRRQSDKKTLNENVDDNSSFISKETIVENTIEGDSISPSMQTYLSAMSRMNKATTANLVM